MEIQAAVWHGILLALESAGITILALLLAFLVVVARWILNDQVLVPLLKRRPTRGLLHGALDWSRDRRRRWRSAVSPDLTSARRRIAGALFAAAMWILSLSLLYRLVAARTSAVTPGVEEAAYLPVLAGLAVVWVAGPLEVKRGLRALPYPASQTQPTTSYLAAEHGFTLSLEQRYTKVSLLNLLRLWRLLVAVFLFLCLPEAATIANESSTAGAQDLAVVVYLGTATILAIVTIKLLHSMLLDIRAFEQIDVLLAAHDPQALPNPPKHPAKKPQIGRPLEQIQRGLDRIAYRNAVKANWYSRVLSAVTDRIDAYRASPAGSEDRRLEPHGIDLLERAGSIVAADPEDIKTIAALAMPIGVVDAEKNVIRVDRMPPRPTWFDNLTGRIERSWKLGALFMGIAAAAWALIAAVTGKGPWSDFWNLWGLG